MVAGIGNIYADEILFQAGIRPDREANSLSAREYESLFSATEKIMKKAIKYRGTTFSDYVGADGRKGGFSRFLNVYGRNNQPCFKCGQVLKKVKLAGRGTHFCPSCQN